MVVLLMVVPWEYLWCLSTRQTSLVLVASMNSWPRPTLKKWECQKIIVCIIWIAILYIDACKPWLNLRSICRVFSKPICYHPVA